MSDKNKQPFTDSFPHMPPPPAHELEIPKKPNILKSKTVKALGALMLSSAILVQPLSTVDRVITAERYQADDIEILPAAGVENIPKGGTEWLVFGGYGQKYSTNAAQELFNALGGTQVVASIKYPNQEFNIDDLADVVADYIQTRGMDKLNIAGVSMGTPIALMTLSRIQETLLSQTNMSQDIVFNKSETTLQTLPELGYFAAYSSPADVKDAYQGSIAETIVGFAGDSDYKPGIFIKGLLASIDGDGDLQRTVNILDTDNWVPQILDNLGQMINSTPPEMVWSHMEFVNAFNATEQAESFQKLFNKNSYFVYISPNGNDDTVDNNGAYKKYQVVMQKIAVPSIFLKTNEPGHANTGASAAALNQWVLGLAMPTNKETNNN